MEGLLVGRIAHSAADVLGDAVAQQETEDVGLYLVHLYPPFHPCAIPQAGPPTADAEVRRLHAAKLTEEALYAAQHGAFQVEGVGVLSRVADGLPKSERVSARVAQGGVATAGDVARAARLPHDEDGRMQSALGVITAEDFALAAAPRCLYEATKCA